MMINVIGGSGFIGTRLVGRLTGNAMHDVRIIDKCGSVAFPKLTRIADVRAVDHLGRAIDDDATLINLAAEHRDDVSPTSLYDDVNVQGARNVCTVAREKNCPRIIFASSVAVYGAAKIGTGEDGEIKPFNEYGRTKHAAEEVYRAWQRESPATRALTIIRPTVVFGEQNRGNVYNLLRQINSGKFVMIGTGENRKSLAYVENVVAFIEHRLEMHPGVEVYNYIDKPDFTMSELVSLVYSLLGRRYTGKLKVPYWIGDAIGRTFDVVALAMSRKFSISAVRVKKFCLDSVYSTAVPNSGFRPPVALEDAIRSTVRFEFVEDHRDKQLFYSE